MKKLISTILMLVLLTTAGSYASYSQTSASSTVTTDQTISFLLNQTRAAKAVIETQNQRIADLEAENALERENSASISKSYEAAKSEIASLRQSNEALNRAVALNEQTIALIQSDRDKWKQKAKKANRDKWKAYLVTAGVIALKVFIP